MTHQARQGLEKIKDNHSGRLSRRV